MKFVQSKIKPNELILNYFVSNHAGINKTTVYLIAISRDSISLVSQNSDNELEDQIVHFVSSITKQSKEYLTQADTISHALLSTIKNNIQGKDLIIIPDKYLYQLPFEVLNGKSQQLFMETNSIRSAPSINHLLIESIPVNANLIGFAPVSENSSDVLYGSAAELKNLSAKYRGNYYTHNQATEQVFKKEAQNFGFIHLSTHSVLDELNSANSYLFFISRSGFNRRWPNVC